MREEGFNVDRVSPPRAQHARRKMKVLAANVKVPQQPSALALKMEMTNKIEDKQILTGQPCHETMVERFVVSENGSIQKEEVKVEGRIIPTMDLRRRILQDHEDKHLMRCHPSTYSAYSTMERCQLEKELSAMGEEVFDEATQPEPPIQVPPYKTSLPVQRPRRCGRRIIYMMGVVQLMYDTALCLSDEEYEEQHGSRDNIQSMVERPYIRKVCRRRGRAATSHSRPPERSEFRGPRYPEGARRSHLRRICRFYWRYECLVVRGRGTKIGRLIL